MLKPEGIALLKFIIESYEGVAVVRTIDPRVASVEIMIAPGFESEIDAIIGELSNSFMILPIKAPETGYNPSSSDKSDKK